MPDRLCPYCFEPVQSMPPDGVDVCRTHGVVEGSTVTEDEPPTSDGPPYTDAVDDEDGMSEVRNELAQNPFDTPSEWEDDHRR